MDINEIKTKYQNLNLDLRQALSTMEKKDSVILIRQQIEELQQLCPHKINDTYDFSHSDHCPYCGKKF